MARIKREAIILIILLGIVLTVSSLIITNIRKEQSLSRQVSAQRQATEYLNYNTPLTDLLDPSTINPGKLRIGIKKYHYQLTLYYDSEAIKSYPVVLGFNAVDDKLRQGDGCTPEGVFKVRDKYPHSSWTRFIWIDYPNQDSWRKHKEAKQRGKIPLSANIGGEVGIHGVPQGYDHLIDERENWTLGCVSLKNKDIIEIYPYITKETVIEITK